MATNNAINIPLPVTTENHGTGVTSLTDHGVLIGSGTSPISVSSAGSTGQLFIGTGSGGDPVFASSANGNFTFTSSTAGVDRTIAIENSDNTNSASAATAVVSVGGSTTTGDPLISFNVSGVNEWRIGIDNSSSDQLLINYGSSFVTNNPFEFNTDGSHIAPLQSTFLGILTTTAADVTGDGTEATLSGLTENFDQNNDFNGTTFTAPVAGIYLIRCVMRLTAAVDMTAGFVSLKTTGYVFKNCFCSPGATRSNFSQKSVMSIALASLAASDTVTTSVTYSNGTKISDIQAAEEVTNFSIVKIA